MEAIITFSSFSLVTFVIMAIFSKGLQISYPHSRVLRSLGRSAQMDKDRPVTPKKDISFSLTHRIIHRFTKQKKGNTQKNIDLAAAGLKEWSPAEWGVLTNSIAFASAFIAGGVSFALRISLLMKIELPLIGFVLGYLIPNAWLKSRVKFRKEEIVRSLPEVLDLILVSVEAGLGFDAALMKVVEKQKGTLADEFNIVLQEIKMGKPRRDALRDMAKKNNVDDLSNVIASLVQADQLGISIGNVLRNQSVQIREKRKQRAQEQAQKAPVKIMIPLVFFIFPSIFIVILGPALIRVLDMFAK